MCLSNIRTRVIKMNVRRSITVQAVAAILLVTAICQEIVCKQKSYDGYKVFKCRPQTQEQVDKLKNLMHEDVSIK